MPRLRSGMIVRLPTGARFVVRQAVANNTFDLLTTNNLVHAPAEAEYRALADGSIVYRGKATVWTVADLVNTGEVAQSLAAGA